MKRSIFAAPLAAVCAMALSSCSADPDERADVGYDDGYAAGYNTTCNIRSTLVEGDWDNQHYAEAYERGYADGATACATQRD